MKEISKTMDILVLLERIWITLNFPAQAQELETLKKKKNALRIWLLVLCKHYECWQC